MGTEAENRDAFRVQAGYSAAMGAPVTTRIVLALATALDRDSATGRRVLDWPGEPVADALVLRLVGGLHALHRAGADPALSEAFEGRVAEPEAVLRRVVSDHDTALLPWLDGPPQTNEAGRSAGLMTGLLHLAERHGLPFELLEIGSSAGLNLLIGRYAFDLGGVCVGPEDAPLAIRPDWRGPPPPSAPVAIRSARGVDIAPVDVRDPAEAARLAAYVWVDAAERQARLQTAVALVREHGVAIDRGDAADWVEARLAEPQEEGTARVLMHSVVWQYLSPGSRTRIAAAMRAAGERATVDRPIGWVFMEPNRDLHRHEIRVRGWPGPEPGSDGADLVAFTHAHGTWVEGLAPPYPTSAYVMRAEAPG